MIENVQQSLKYFFMQVTKYFVLAVVTDELEVNLRVQILRNS
jgi:hypothetical protein